MNLRSFVEPCVSGGENCTYISAGGKEVPAWDWTESLALTQQAADLIINEHR
jgi:hypothetical protein